MLASARILHADPNPQEQFVDGLPVTQNDISSLFRYCRSLTSTSWDAEDLLQDTLLKSCQVPESRWSEVHVLSYMRKIALNTLRDARKRKAYSTTDQASEFADTQMNFARYPLVPWLDMAMAVETMLTHLTMPQTTTLLLKEVFGFTASEIGEMLEMSPGSVKAMLHRARRQLHRDQQQGEQDEQGEQRHLGNDDVSASDVDASDVSFFVDAIRNADFRPIVQRYWEVAHSVARKNLQSHNGGQPAGRQDVLKMCMGMSAA